MDTSHHKSTHSNEYMHNIRIEGKVYFFCVCCTTKAIAGNVNKAVIIFVAVDFDTIYCLITVEIAYNHLGIAQKVDRQALRALHVRHWRFDSHIQLYILSICYRLASCCPACALVRLRPYAVP